MLLLGSADVLLATLAPGPPTKLLRLEAIAIELDLEVRPHFPQTSSISAHVIGP